MIDEHAQPLLAGVDIGGTFTDVVLSVGGELRLHKLLSTPEQPARAMLAGLAAIGAMGATVTHGSTVATNAILERRGARTALITTEGFRDLLFIGRQNRPVLYALHPAIPPPLIPRAWCREVPERLDFQGKILVPLDIAALDAVLDDLAAQGIESVAVCLLYSYINPVHEHAIRDRMIARELFQPEQIALSSDVLPEFREFERASTTAIDAYVRPIVSRYLAEVEAGLAPPPPPPHLRWRGENPQKAISQEQRDQPEMSITPSPSADGEGETAFQVDRVDLADQPQRLISPSPSTMGRGSGGGAALFIMQSDGGVVRAATARRQAARMALSGPAAGVIGAMHLARLADFEQIITLDIGGTSTDVALCPGDPVRRTETSIDGLPLHLPVIDIETVGAGGGSLARLDAGGALRVGPASAGADPGPIIYGRGGQVVTVSDAHAVLGRLDPAHFLGGAMPLHLAPAQAALAALGEAMSSDGVTAARGVIAVANANIQRAIRRISVERGYDPRDFTLLAFGGAGPLHACEVAEGLGMTRVLVPSFPGVLCAFGLLVAEVARAASRTVLMPATPEQIAAALALVAEMAERGRADLAEEGIAPDAIATEAIFEMRYQGQAYELPVPATAEAVAAFHAAHARRYGFALPERAVELVTLRVRTAGPRCRPALKREATTPNDGGDALRATKEMLIDGAARAVPCYERVALRPGAAFAGPCLVLQRDTTTYVSPGWHATVDGYRNLLLALAP